MERYQIEFHISEHASLRSEIARNMTLADSTIIYSLVANSTVFWWVKTQEVVDVTVLVASFLPLVITILSYSMYKEFIAGVFRIAGYCKLVEHKLAEDGLGWENYLDGLRGDSKNTIKIGVFHAIFFLQYCLSLFLVVSTLYIYV